MCVCVFFSARSGVSNLRRATSPQHVAAAWRRFYPALSSARVPLLVMTNEREARWARRLRALLPQAVLGRELREVREMHAALHDNCACACPYVPVWSPPRRHRA